MVTLKSSNLIFLKTLRAETPQLKLFGRKFIPLHRVKEYNIAIAVKYPKRSKNAMVFEPKARKFAIARSLVFQKRRNFVWKMVNSTKFFNR